MSDKLKIAPLVASIISSLKYLISDLKGNSVPHASAVNSYLARFKLWSANSGAHRAHGTRSLEYKLRDALSLRNHIVSLLKGLWDAVDEARESVTVDRSSDQNEEDPGLADDELAQYFSESNDPEISALDKLVDDIKRMVERLLRLAVVIKNPTPHEQFSSRQADNFIKNYEPFDVSHVQEKFPGVSYQLAERLGRSLSIRRQYFRYREERFNRRVEDLDADLSQRLNLCEQTTTAGSSIPERFKDRGKTAQQIADVVYDDIYDRSEVATSYAASEVNTTELRVPPIPKEYIEGPFKCPFCHSLVSLSDRQGWKRHVFRDLQPYVCLSNTCPTPDRLYGRRSDWEQHMRLQHWKFWKCPFGCCESMHTAEEFEEHTASRHKSEVSPQHLESLVEMCSVPDSTKARGQCILCNHRLTSDRFHISHVASHLEQLALHALPRLDYDGDDDDGCDERDEHIEDDKINNTNGELEREQSDQDQDDNDDYDEHAFHEESVDQNEDPKSLSGQPGPSMSFNMRIQQGPANTVVKAYVDPQLSKLLNKEWDTYHGLVSANFLHSHGDFGHPFTPRERFNEECLFEYKGTYVRGIGGIRWKWHEDGAPNKFSFTSAHLLVCREIPGGMDIIVKDKPEGNSTVKAVSITDEKVKHQSREHRKVRSISANTSNKGTGTQKTKTVWYCCICNFGPCNINLDDFCPNPGCRHQRCSSCIVMEIQLNPRR